MSCPRESTTTVYAGRQGQVHLPLGTLDKCKICQKSSQEVKLRCCTACGEAIYCSTECQEKDWTSHKVRCGPTDRIDLQSFYPFLGYIARISHCLHPTHPALSHKVVDVEEFVALPNGHSARLVHLGPSIPPECFSSELSEWWPTGPTTSVRQKLARRIAYEGFLLPTLLSICIALVAEMYTTTALRKDEPILFQSTGRRRVRLTHKQSPIADFGIVKGSTRVIDSDRLAYYSTVTKKLWMGQDPNDHYRIYFKTLAGHEYSLDVGMYTFNFNLAIEASRYSALYNKELGIPEVQGVDAVSAIFTDMAPNISILDQMQFQPRKRFSVLRDTKIQSVIQARFADAGPPGFRVNNHLALDMMDKIAGRRCGDDEKKTLILCLDQALRVLRLNMERRDYNNFPMEHKLAIGDAEPDEAFPPVDEETRQRLTSFWDAQCKKLKKGKISKEECLRQSQEMKEGEKARDLKK